jgi:hypothetical protein
MGRVRSRQRFTGIHMLASRLAGIQNKEKTMNRVTGKVLLKETNVGIADLLVEVYDVDPGTRPEDLMAPSGSGSIAVLPGTNTRTSQVNLIAERLLSMATGPSGEFSGEYDDADFRRRNPEERRPDLMLLVRAPEETSGDPNTRVLFVSKEARVDAANHETYVVRIPLAALTAAGLSAPTDLALETEDPDAITNKMKVAVTRQVKLNFDVQKIAAEQVAAERDRSTRIEKQVEERLLEKLTGIPTAAADRFNYVPPGGNVESAMFRAVKKSIDATINKKPPAKGFLVLSPEQAQAFKIGEGTFRDNIPGDELEPLLFGGRDAKERPTFLIREDPLGLLSRTQTKLFPDRNGGEESGRSRDGSVASPAPTDGTAEDSPVDVTPETIPDFVGRLLSTMTSPEEAVAFGVKPRATQEEVDSEVGNFRLRSGPADVPAFYDFHSLQIAFDYVWQKAIDEGVVESASTLSRQLLDMGGDPLAAISNGTDPVKALRHELRTVQTAHASTNLGIMFRKQTSIFRKDTGGLPPQPNGSIPVPPVKGIFDDIRPTTFPDTVFEQVNPLPHELLNQIESLLNERHAFEIFAPGSVNFGILVSYRQRWAPINYQVGNLVKTMTLAPKETRKVSTKRVVKKDRSVKEMEDSLRIRKEESNTTARDEAEIIAKAEAKTNFKLTAKGSYNILISKGDSTTDFGKDAATNSSDTKKAFREAVVKAAQEYKDERKLEVETKESREDEVTESSEISNPNDELPVTYLFYELQRRYKIAEHIHRLTPVVLVAMDVPNPGRRSIDRLLLTYGWIIDRVLLDDQFRRPLEYFRTKIVGDEVALATLAQNVRIMAGVVEELKKSYTRARTISNQTADLLTAEAVRKAQAVAENDSEGFFEQGKEFLFGESGGSESVEAFRILEDAARERHERAVAQEKELRSQLDSEAAALKAANDAYARAHAEHLNCLMDVGALRLHIKENILYYMQAIWSHTFDDQIFLALHKKKVPRLAVQEKSYKLSQPGQTPSSVTAGPGQVVVGVEASLKLQSDLNPDEDFVTLAEVADLDNLMGFKGNYLIFPLKVSNALTDFMMTPFVDSELGLRDPDEFGNFTPDEFVAYARALHAQMKEQLENGQITEEELNAAVERLTAQYKRLLSAPRRAEDEITVPTGSLYIEALPGAHPILEDYKLMHRAVDVKKVQAEVRKLEMENVRYAARIVVGERDDPDVERKVVIAGGNGQPIVVPPVEN